MSKRGDAIRDNMRLAGTYNQAFEPIIKTLARIQTELAKAERDWRANGGKFVTEYTNKSGATNAVKDPYYSVVEGLRGQIVDISAQLGLTPTGQRRVLGNAFQSTRPVWDATANLTILPRQICTKGTKEFLLGRKTHGKKEK